MSAEEGPENGESLGADSAAGLAPAQAGDEEDRASGSNEDAVQVPDLSGLKVGEGAEAEAEEETDG